MKKLLLPVILSLIVTLLISGCQSRYRARYRTDYRTDYIEFVDTLLLKADSIAYEFRLDEQDEYGFNPVWEFIETDSVKIHTFLSSIHSNRTRDYCVCLPDGYMTFYSNDSIINTGHFFYNGEIVIKPSKYDRESRETVNFYITPLSNTTELLLRDYEYLVVNKKNGRKVFPRPEDIEQRLETAEN